MQSNSDTGFTLLELMVGLAISVILVGLATPLFREFILNQQIEANSSAFFSALYFSRNEAIKRNLPVGLCPFAANQSSVGCANGNWQNGWIIFVDNNRSYTYENGIDELITIEELQMNDINIAASQSTIIYGENGFLIQGSGNYRMTTKDCLSSKAVNINVGNNGRIQMGFTNCS